MRLFDSTEEVRRRAAALRDRERIKQRAQQMEELLKETQDLDAASRSLGEKLAQVEAVRPVRYRSFRRPGSKWQIEHAQVGHDYMIQMFPLRPTTLDVADVLSHLILAMDAIYPSSVHIRYLPPASDYKIQFYTIKIENVVGLPGWEQAIADRTLHALSAVEAW